MTVPDQLTKEVRTILSFVLDQSDFPGVEQLRAQANAVTVESGPLTMLGLQVSAGWAASDFTDGPIPVSISVSGASGSAIGELLLWVENGFVSALEFAWWSDEPPTELPNRGHLRVTRR